jgi:hypothetical protein
VPNRLSAIESISPAFARTKQLLFQPFRFGLWARLAVVAVITGEAGVGGGGGGSIPNFNRNSSGEDHWASHWSAQPFNHAVSTAHFVSEPRWEQIQPYLGWIALGIGLTLAALFLWIYSDCVFRFILLDTVLTGHCRLREGWRRWRAAGRRYFVWAVSFGFGALFLTGIVAGVPVLLAYRAGWFEKPEDNLGLLIGWGILLVLVLIVLVAALAVIQMLARDFLIPVMAFEEVAPIEGWRKLLGMMGADKLAYAAYVLMKIVLAMGSAVIFTIVNVVVILVLAIPLVLLGLAGYFIGKAAGFSWDISTQLLLAALGLLVFAGILYVVGFVYAPGLVFFQSYTVEFFAARYGPLEKKVSPPMLPVPPAPPTAPPVPGDAFLS